MARPCKYSDRERQKSRIWEVILYPDSSSYNCAQIIDNIRLRSVQYIFAFHDRDLWSAADLLEYQNKHDGKLPSWSVGDLKKPHYHVIFILGNSTQLGLVSDLIQLKSNFIEKVENKVGAIQYLIHLNNPEKFQYPIDVIESNIINWKRKYFELESDMKASNILDEIDRRFRHGEIISIASMAQWTLLNGCWDEFRRGQHIWTSIILEYNQRKDY